MPTKRVRINFILPDDKQKDQSFFIVQASFMVVLTTIPDSFFFTFFPFLYYVCLIHENLKSHKHVFSLVFEFICNFIINIKFSAFLVTTFAQFLYINHFIKGL